MLSINMCVIYVMLLLLLAIDSLVMLSSQAESIQKLTQMLDIKAMLDGQAEAIAKLTAFTPSQGGINKQSLQESSPEA